MSDIRLERLKANARFLAGGAKDLELINSIASTKMQINIQVEESGWKNLMLERGGGLHRFHRELNPFKEWSERIDAAAENAVVICLGTGFGYQLPDLIPSLPKDSNLILLETQPEAYFVFLTELDLENILPPGTKIIFAPQPEMLFEYLLRHIYRYHRTPVQLIPLDTFGFFSPGYIESVVFALEDHTSRHQVYIRSLEEQRDAIYQNTLGNISHLKESNVATEGGAGKERALIVASGPSTEWNLPVIRAIREFVHIIAVGSAMEPLLRNSIEPDLVVVSDPNPINRTHFPQEEYALPLLYNIVIPSEIVSKFRGLRTICNVGHGLEELIFEATPLLRLTGWGTVASITLDFCVKAGFSEVAFIGTDFSYISEKAHMEDYQVDFSPQDEIQLKDDYGLPIKTTKAFKDYAAYFNDQIANYSSSRTRIINCCDGGLVSGGERINLREYYHRVRVKTRGKKPILKGKPFSTHSAAIKAMIEAIGNRVGEAEQALSQVISGRSNLNEWSKLPAAYAFEGLLLEDLKALEGAMMGGKQNAVEEAVAAIRLHLRERSGLIIDELQKLSK